MKVFPSTTNKCYQTNLVPAVCHVHPDKIRIGLWTGVVAYRLTLLKY
jgi:hypothetical protein